MLKILFSLCFLRSGYAAAYPELLLCIEVFYMLNIQTLKNTLNNYILNLKIHLRELGSPRPYRNYVSDQNAKDKSIL